MELKWGDKNSNTIEEELAMKFAGTKIKQAPKVRSSHSPLLSMKQAGSNLTAQFLGYIIKNGKGYLCMSYIAGEPLIKDLWMALNHG